MIRKKKVVDGRKKKRQAVERKRERERRGYFFFPFVWSEVSMEDFGMPLLASSETTAAVWLPCTTAS
jgi:hypothetical protein